MCIITVLLRTRNSAHWTATFPASLFRWCDSSILHNAIKMVSFTCADCFTLKLYGTQFSSLIAIGFCLDSILCLRVNRARDVHLFSFQFYLFLFLYSLNNPCSFILFITNVRMLCYGFRLYAVIKLCWRLLIWCKLCAKCLWTLDFSFAKTCYHDFSVIHFLTSVSSSGRTHTVLTYRRCLHQLIALGNHSNSIDFFAGAIFANAIWC